MNGGACAASVLVKDGELHVANVGDCKVILSRKGVATALTKDHRLTREDERIRIEKSVSKLTILTYFLFLISSIQFQIPSYKLT